MISEEYLTNIWGISWKVLGQWEYLENAKGTPEEYHRNA